MLVVTPRGSLNLLFGDSSVEQTRFCFSRMKVAESKFQRLKRFGVNDRDVKCLHLFWPFSASDFGNVCHVFHLEMFAFALAFQDVSIEDVCICISFSFQFVHLCAFYSIYAESRLGTDSRLESI